MDKTRPLIGVITARAYEPEQRQLLCGIIEQAQEMGLDTAVFSSIYDSEIYYAGVEIENRIYDLLQSPRLCGLILLAESILNEAAQQQIHRTIKGRDVPTIVIGAEIPGLPCINTNAMTDLSDITRHLVEIHGFTDIDLLNGPDGNPTSIEREEGYRQALLSGGIPYDKKKVIYGNFWMNSGDALAKAYMSGTRRMPQAVVCANDYMAYGLCDALLAGGIRVPEDMTVVGYEYVGERFYHAPILTTYLRNRRGLGKQAVRMLISLLDGKERESLPLSGTVICGDSCPCGTDPHLLCRELEAVRTEQYYSRMNLAGNLEQQLTQCRNLDEYIRGLQQFVFQIRGCVGLYLCLYEDWYSRNIPEELHGSTMLCCPVIAPDGKPQKPAYYDKSELFADVITTEKTGDALYFCPIFFAGQEMGYFILQYDKPDVYDVIFRDWLKIASNALENLRMRNDIRTLLECQQLSEHHDSLTGLLNRQGLEKEMTALCLRAAPDAEAVLLLVRSGCSAPSADAMHTLAALRSETAQILRRLTDGTGLCCGKLADQLFCIGGVGTDLESPVSCLVNKLRAMLEHAPARLECSSWDSIFIRYAHVPAGNFSFPEMLKTLKEEIETDGQRYTRFSCASDTRSMRQLRSELYQNPQREWSAQKVCRDLLFSAGHFRARYKEIFGISFHQDVIQSRISLAKYLLLTTSQSAASIARKCGYEDSKYFLRQFRQLTGMTPQQYRQPISIQ